MITEPESLIHPEIKRIFLNDPHIAELAKHYYENIRKDEWSLYQYLTTIIGNGLMLDRDLQFKSWTDLCKNTFIKF